MSVRALCFFAIAASLSLFAACGLDAGGSLDTSGDAASPGADGNAPDGNVGAEGGADASGNDATGIDGSTDAAPESSPLDAGVDASPDSGCLLSNGCYVVPAGWSLVAIDPTQNAPACPSGYTAAGPTDTVESPVAGPSACGCRTCSTTTPPNCTSGAVKVYFDVGSMVCALPGQPSQNNNNPPGACGTDMYNGSLNNFDLKLVPPPPTGGACSSAGQLQKQNVTYGGRLRECHPDTPGAASCNGNECTPMLAPPYAACIEMSGDQTCPAPYTVKHHVGTDVAYTCGDCPCTVSATCSGTMTLYTDNGCMNGAHQLAVDNQCHGAGTGGSFHSYKYAGTTSDVTCAAGAAPPPQNLTLVNDQTICCAP